MNSREQIRRAVQAILDDPECARKARENYGQALVDQGIEIPDAEGVNGIETFNSTIVDLIPALDNVLAAAARGQKIDLLNMECHQPSWLCETEITAGFGSAIVACAVSGGAGGCVTVLSQVLKIAPVVLSGIFHNCGKDLVCLVKAICHDR